MAAEAAVICCCVASALVTPLEVGNWLFVILTSFPSISLANSTSKLGPKPWIIRFYSSLSTRLIWGSVISLPDDCSSFITVLLLIPTQQPEPLKNKLKCNLYMYWAPKKEELLEHRTDKNLPIKLFTCLHVVTKHASK